MNNYVAIAGWLNIAQGLVGLILGLVLFLAPEAVVSGGWIGEGYLLASWLGAAFALLSLPYVVAGVGLLKRQRWSKFLAVVLSVFSLFMLPLGTLVGIYTIWVLTRYGLNAAPQ
jgi:hypothetical protein